MTIDSVEKQFSQPKTVPFLESLSNKIQYLDGLLHENLNIGILSYQICKNWFDAHRGQALSKEEAYCYQKLVNVLKEINELMGEITITIQHERLKKLEILEKIKAILVEKLEIESAEIISTTNFAQDFGADSLVPVQIVMVIKEAFGIEMPERVAETLITVQQVVDYISRNSHITV